jgi:hypothetical protein
MLFDDRDEPRFRVGLPPEEVCARLSGAIGREGILLDAGEQEVVGHVHGGTFRLRVGSSFRNSFRPYLHGRVEAVPEGSRIVVRLGLHPLIKPFMLCWLGGTIAFGLLWSAALLLDGFGTWNTPEPARRLLLLAPAGMFAFGILLVRFGRRIGRGEERRLLAIARQWWGPPAPES